MSPYVCWFLYTKSIGLFSGVPLLQYAFERRGPMNREMRLQRRRRCEKTDETKEESEKSEKSKEGEEDLDDVLKQWKSQVDLIWFDRK